MIPLSKDHYILSYLANLLIFIFLYVLEFGSLGFISPIIIKVMALNCF